MTSPLTAIGAQLSGLREAIAASNEPGDIEGLAARFFAGDLIGDWNWNVDLAVGSSGPSNPAATEYPVVAAMGYSIAFDSASDRLRVDFADGMESLRTRDPFPADGLSFGSHAIAMLGVCLGVRSMTPLRASDAEAWLLNEVLRDPRSSPTSAFGRVVHDITLSVMTGSPNRLVSWPDDVDAFALALWGERHGYIELPTQPSAEEVQSRLEAMLSVDHRELDAPRAAAIVASIRMLLQGSLEVALGRDSVADVLRQFEPAMRRWPLEGWPINDEKDVQAILHVMLRTIWPDVIDEETLRKVGHSFYIPDFAIPSLRLLIEVKFARRRADLKKVEKEVLQDASAYVAAAAGQFDQLVVFIYDHSASVQEHALVGSALERVSAIRSVVVVSRPSGHDP
jgi:hypothetical protein